MHQVRPIRMANRGGRPRAAAGIGWWTTEEQSSPLEQITRHCRRARDLELSASGPARHVAFIDADVTLTERLRASSTALHAIVPFMSAANLLL